MGVHGLWQLLSSTGKPVPLESLEGKVLAVDVSVWLHQLSKGMRDSSGNPLPNAHLHGLFTRICKLLYYRIKPVFVFDGGVPMLKKQTLASRRNKRDDAEKTSSLMQQKILTNLIRSQALKEACGLDKLPDLPPPSKSSAKGNKDVIYQLPPIPDTNMPYMSQKSAEDKTYIQRRELQDMVEDQYEDITKIDVESEDFKALPPDVQHEIMTDMRLRKKNYNLSKIVDLPDDSKDFSKYQMAKLLKHNKVNSRLEEVRKEMNSRQTRSLTKNFKGRFKDSDDIYSQRVVSEDSAHYVLAKRNLSRKKEEESQKMIKSAVESVTDELGAIEEVDELLIDSDVDSCSEVDVLEESRLIFEELSGKTDELNDDLEDKRQKITKKDELKQPENNKNKGKEDKPRFRAVIEVESDSGSDSSDDSVIVVGDETAILDDTNVDPELQFAIELSLQEQRKSGKNKKRDLSAQGSELLERTKNVDTQRTMVKDLNNSNNSGIPVVSAGRQTRQKSNEQRKQGVVEPSKEQPNKQKKVKANSSIADNDNFRKPGKMHSNDSDGRRDDESKHNKKIDKVINERNKDKSTKDKQGNNKDAFLRNDEQSNNKDAYSRRRQEDVGEMKSKIFKRKISCLSNDSAGSCEEPSKVRKIDNSDDGTDVEADMSESSESEGDFIEVKVDLTKVRADDLFPASMFKDAGEAVESKPALKFPASMFEEAGEKTETKPALHEEDAINVDDTDIVIEEDDNKVVMDKRRTSKVDVDSDKIIDKVTVVESDIEEVANESRKDNSMERNDVSVDDQQLEIRSTGSDVLEADDDITMVSEADDISLDSAEVALDVDNKKRPTSPVVPNLVKQFESLNEQDVKGLRMNLASENKQLRLEQGRQERLAVSITDQMHTEAQELLQLFGIPFIVSPTEAEAQCAQLELVKLTHGTITDDSDIWLFGGKCVFKNFFNQQKHVECFKDVNISSQLGLNRESLINLALLCGSDYTEGIRGVGPVTAMEILAKFQGRGVESLQKLKSWWENTQKEIRIPVTASKLLTKLRELDIHEGFPNTQVVEAYLSPVVDDSTEKFTWSLPNLEQLRQFAGSKLKWNREKTDEVLLPVIKRLNEKQSQRSIVAFFQPEVYMNPAPVKSKRLQKVVNKFVNPTEEQEDSENEQEKKKTRSKGQGDGKKTRSKSQTLPAESENIQKEPTKVRRKAANKKTKDINQDKAEEESDALGNSRIKTDVISTEKIESSGVVPGTAGNSSETKVRGTTARGRGKGRGRGRGQRSSLRSGAGKIEKEKIILSDSESSSVDTESDSSISLSDDYYDDSSDGDDSNDGDDEITKEINVVQTGLNIDEILKLKMGCTFNEMRPVKKPKQEGKVVENIMNVNEILHLETGADDVSKLNDDGIDNDHNDLDAIDKVDDAIKDKEVMESEKFANEGGFIKEDDFEMEDCPELESDDFMKQLQTLEENCAIDNERANSSDVQKTSKQKGKTAKVSNSVVDTSAEDSCKIETKRTRSSRTNNKREGSKVLKSVTRYNPVDDIESEDNGNLGGDTKIKELDMSKEANTVNYDINNFDMEEKVVKMEATELEDSSEAIVSSKSESVEELTLEKPTKPSKTATKLKKVKPDSIYKSDPIKPLVSGLPWADKRKGQKKGQSAKGKGKAKLHTIAPVETIKKKAKPAQKKTFDCVNLSESDSD